MYLNVGPWMDTLALSRRYILMMGSLVKGTLLKVPDHCYFDTFRAQGRRGPTIKCLSCPVWRPSIPSGFQNHAYLDKIENN